MDKNLNKQINSLLALKAAPKGSISNDFKVALYVVAAIYQLDFAKHKNLGICNSLLGDVGFLADPSLYTQKDYDDTLADLVNTGALVPVLPSSRIYVAANDYQSFTTKVRSKEDIAFKIEGKKVYSYYITDDNGIDYNLRSEFVILPNDEVEVIIPKLSKIAYVRKVSKVRQSVIGRLMKLGKDKYELISDEPNLKSYAFKFASNADIGEAKVGDVVIAQLVKRVSNSLFLVKTREVVKDLGDLNNIIVMAVLRNDIPSAWPDNMNRALARVPNEVTAKDLKGRVDLRALPLMTIDGEDARDFDDAVYCQKNANGFRLYVSIADVSYYVKPGTVLDSEAMNRCNSCYFPNFVIPMLPEKLSNGICSLNPDVDRLCMTCEMEITADGKIKNYKFYPAVMRSHARLTYNEAYRMIKEGSADFKEHEFAIPYVQELHNLYKAFVKNRRQRGGMSIESEELHFIFNEDMKIQGVAPLQRNDAHKLIEECMVAANVAAASYVAERKSQTLYRVHARPQEKKLTLLQTQLARFGLNLKGGDTPNPKDYMQLADSVANREDAKLLNELILRSMSKAEYSPENIGHFGLALEKYAHFTSPIRRYADLQLHRVIKHLIAKETATDLSKMGARAYNKTELTALGTKCTQREIAADIAEREVDATLACIFIQEHIGEVAAGTVTAVTSFGVFVRLDDYGVDGMIYVGDFNSYMRFNEKTQTLSSDWGESYGVGKKIKVVIGGVNFEELKINLYPNHLSKNELKALRKERDYNLEKKKKISQNSPKKDKVAILNSLKDISFNREAKEEDTVLRTVQKLNHSKMFDFDSEPYQEGVGMKKVYASASKNSKRKGKK